MPAFNASTVATITLDEYDTVTISGSARLQITVATRPTFETNISAASLVYGPYGSVTTIVLNGLGIGTYVVSQSNVRVPMVMIDLSAGQIAAPTAAQLAASAVLYQLNSAPYTIYQTNGTSLVAVGAGGITAFSSLSDSTTADLPTTNAPLAAALATKVTDPGQATLTSGATMTRAGHLNRPLIIGGTTASTQAFTNAAGTTGLIGGDSYYLRNSSTATFTATGTIIAPTGFKLTAGPNEVFSADYDSIDDAWRSTTVDMSAVAGVAALTVLSATIPSGAPNTVVEVYSRAIYDVLPAATTKVVNVAGANRTSTAIAKTAADTTTTTFDGAAVTNGQTVNLSYTAAGSRIVSLDTGTPLQNFAATAVTNNVAAAGTLSATTFSASNININTSTSPVFADWLGIGINSSGAGGINRLTNKPGDTAAGGPLIGMATTGSCANVGSYGGLTTTLSWDLGENLGSTSTYGPTSYISSAGYAVGTDSSMAGLLFTAPAVNSFTRKIRIYGANFSNFVLHASLSDASATMSDITLPSSEFYYEISFRSSSPTATLTFSIQKASAGASMSGARDFAITGVTLQTA
ncbi:MAG: hypothetical protein JWQ89_3560 [Devosia sp.]|uniref:hypothetical protein n=1 Tax=Devosia sp. TaxID=1871048 RepID=UPI002630060D|nr:hypothetical protein [Devosia sp.]MDB5541833.1 hypothetical protein [Devosia sp.]